MWAVQYGKFTKNESKRKDYLVLKLWGIEESFTFPIPLRHKTKDVENDGAQQRTYEKCARAHEQVMRAAAW